MGSPFLLVLHSPTFMTKALLAQLQWRATAGSGDEEEGLVHWMRRASLLRARKLVYLSRERGVMAGGGLQNGGEFGSKARIECTQEERAVFDTLLEVVRERNLDCTLRAAGGWVRDKLLGKTEEAPDVDVAIDTMPGKRLAEELAEHLRSKHGEEGAKYAVIQSNPEQSKHLETATMKIRSISVDMVNLRSEKYAEGSRIPEMEFGTPEEDAYRRDLTINALFYNITTGTVEDYTGRGLHDLREGRIRTPLEPRQTLLDDPLRALRAIRFAVRFGFSLDTSLESACADESVKHALLSKVSRERVGAELDGMLKSADPLRAVSLISRLSLFTSTLHPDKDVPAGAAEACAFSSEFVTALVVKCMPDSVRREFLSGEDQCRWLYLAAYLLPLRHEEVEVGGKKRSRPAPLADQIVRSGLKLRSKDAESVVLCHNCAQPFQRLLERLPTEKPSRSEVGQAVRSSKSLWPISVALAGATLAKADEINPQVKPPNASEAEERVRDLVELVVERELTRAHEEKTLLDGKAVMRSLGWQKGGPELGKVLEEMMEWQLDHPNASREDAEQWLQEEWLPDRA